MIYKVKKLLGETNIVEQSPNHISAVDVDFEGDTSLRWDDDFKIDVNEIDEEHKKIIDKYERLYELMKEGKGHKYYLELLLFLNDYVNTHFAHEQLLHKKENYPLKEAHIEIHEEFKASILKLQKLGLEKDITDMDLIKINIFIKNWLVHHILIEDRKFGDYLLSIENSQS